MNTDDTLRALETRLAAVEDELAIQRVVAAYGPAADSGSGQRAAALWTQTGSYDAQVGEWRGRADIAAMFDADMHRGLMHAGCAHVLTLPTVVVDGDRAAATCYGLLLRHDGDDFRVWRVTATRWELVREPDGWRIERRVNKLLDGDPDARALLGHAPDVRP